MKRKYLFSNMTVSAVVVATIVAALMLSIVGLAAAQEQQPTESPAEQATAEATAQTATPFVGIQFSEADQGVSVQAVVADSPAAASGLKVGDVITAVDGEAVTVDNFASVIQGKAAGDQITLSVTRDGSLQEVTLTLGEAPAEMTLPHRDGRPGIMPNLLKDRPFLGVQLADQDGKVVIAEVSADSPAATAGLQTGDVITELNGTSVENAQTLASAIQAMKPGDEVTLKVTRDGNDLEITATLDSAPGIAVFPGKQGRVVPEGRGTLGVQVEETDQGVVVRSIASGSLAERLGIQTGDIIKTVNGKDVTSANDVREALQSAQDNGQIALTLDRNGTTVELSFTTSDLGSADGNGMFNNGHGGMFSINPGQFTYLSDESAWEVQELAETSDYYKAGLRTGDKITAINGETVSPEQMLTLLMPMMGQSDPVKLTVQRGTETTEIEVSSAILADLFFSAQETYHGMFDFGMPNMPGMPDFNFDFGGRGMQLSGAILGVEAVLLDEQSAQEYNAPQTTGLYIVRVYQNSPASKAGLQAGDIVIAINGAPVTDTASLRSILSDLKSGDTLKLDVMRDGQNMQLELTVEALSGSNGLHMPFPIIPDFPTPDSPGNQDNQKSA